MSSSKKLTIIPPSKTIFWSSVAPGGTTCARARIVSTDVTKPAERDLANRALAPPRMQGLVHGGSRTLGHEIVSLGEHLRRNGVEPLRARLRDLAEHVL